MIAPIRNSAEVRGISRLCHFTSSRNLAHILSDPRGLVNAQQLATDDHSIFNPTDRHRFDGHEGYVCCSIEYPNAWYLRTVHRSENTFLDWVVLFIRPCHLWESGTKFCCTNASRQNGTLIKQGPAAFEELFALKVTGQRVFHRTANHPEFLPTDEQAEVLIPGCIPLGDIIGVAVRDSKQARSEVAALSLLKLEIPPIVIATELFDPNTLDDILKSGRRPNEQEYAEGAKNGS